MSNNHEQLPNSEEIDGRRKHLGHIAAKLIIEKLTKKPSLELLIDETKGPFIEVGSVPSNPQTTRSKLIDLQKIKKPLITSNIYRPQTLETGYKHRITGERKTIIGRENALNERLWKLMGSEPKIVENGPDWGKPIKDTIDFIADATNLPVADGSVGALYARALGPGAELKFLSDEAPRSLEPGGMLVLEHVKEASLAAENPYLTTLRLDRSDNTGINYAAVRNNVPYQIPQSEQLA